jgi:hypothetical protein
LCALLLAALHRPSIEVSGRYGSFLLKAQAELSASKANPVRVTQCPAHAALVVVSNRPAFRPQQALSVCTSTTSFILVFTVAWLERQLRGWGRVHLWGWCGVVWLPGRSAGMHGCCTHLVLGELQSYVVKPLYGRLAWCGYMHTTGCFNPMAWCCQYAASAHANSLVQPQHAGRHSGWLGGFGWSCVSAVVLPTQVYLLQGTQTSPSWSYRLLSHPDSPPVLRAHRLRHTRTHHLSCAPTV